MLPLFIIIWIIISIVIGLIGAILLIDENRLPPWFTVLYKYGKMLQNFNNGERTVANFLLIKFIQIPKRYFSHFYFLAVILHLVIILYTFFHADATRQLLAKPLGLIFGSVKYDGISIYLFYFLCLTHIFRRFIETVLIAVPSSAKINMIHYLTGMLFYTSVAAFNANNLVGSVKISRDRPILYTIGLLFHLSGQVLQFHCHATLADLRRRYDKPRGRASYYLPTGGLFDYVACPNYFAELIIYTGLFMLSGLNLNWLALYIWVIVNQTISALLTLRWYKQTFGPRYPPNKKAIIPFIL